jgi:hypothetical protein
MNRVWPMARYYFDLRRGDNVSHDVEGMELSTIEAVRQEAVHAVADLAPGAIRGYLISSEHFLAIEVRDDSGPVLQVNLHWTVIPKP